VEVAALRIAVTPEWLEPERLLPVIL